MAEYVRSFWKGHLRLALVSIPIRLVSAQKTENEIALHQVDRKSKQRIRYSKTAPGRGEVAKDDIVMGYEVEPGNYVILEEDELDSLKVQSRHTIELTQFVDSCEIDPLYFERPYYVLPDGEAAEEGYRVIRDALRVKRKVGIGQLALRGRESLVALYPGGGGLVVDTLRYEHEIKDADAIFAQITGGKTRDDMREMAEELIDRRTQSFDPGKYKDHYAHALKELIAAKLSKGDTVTVEAAPEQGAKVLDFMEALRRSVQGGGGSAAGDAARPGGDEPAKPAAPPKAKATKAKSADKAGDKAEPSDKPARRKRSA